MSDYYVDDYTPSRNQVDQLPSPVSPQRQNFASVVSNSEIIPRVANRVNQRRQQQLAQQQKMSLSDLFRKAIKYAVLGLAVAAAAYLLLKDRIKLTTKDLLILAGTAALVFAILDTFAPLVGVGAKLGTGFAIGQGLIPLAIAL